MRRISVMLAALAVMGAASPKITDTPAWQGQGPGWTPMMAVLVDRQTGEQSAPMGWGECMERRGAYITATGAQSLSEHYQAGERYVCELLK
jgi:hypothetical protein